MNKFSFFCFRIEAFTGGYATAFFSVKSTYVYYWGEIENQAGVLLHRSILLCTKIFQRSGPKFARLALKDDIVAARRK